MADLKTYSLVIAWNDDDTEQGTFGDTVRACGTEHAERIVRARMIKSHWANHREEGEGRRDSLAGYDNFDGSYFGSVMECSEGAIWKAADLEKALRLAVRALVAVHGEPAMPEAAPLENALCREAVLAGRAILGEIDDI